MSRSTKNGRDQYDAFSHAMASSKSCVALSLPIDASLMPVSLSCVRAAIDRERVIEVRALGPVARRALPPTSCNAPAGVVSSQRQSELLCDPNSAEAHAPLVVHCQQFQEKTRFSAPAA